MEFYLGMICAFGFSYAPVGWLTCQGQLLNINQNSALYSLLGTYYGGNGSTNFGLPNLQGRGLVGQGILPGGSNYAIGQIGGMESTTLTVNQMPLHVHGLTANSISNQAGSAVDAVGDATTPTNNFLALSPKIGSGPNATQLKTYATAAATPVKLAGGAITTSTNGNTTVAGGSQPFSILNPYLAVNYSIAIQGIYPSRN